MKLTIKQKKFADEYIISGNATDAYKKAGYAWNSEGAANSNASDLQRNHNVKIYIAERMKALEDKAIAKQEEVLEYLTSVMRGEQQEETLIWQGQGEQSITNIEVSAKDRIKAAELLGKRYGIWTEKQDITVDVPVLFEGIDDVDD